MSRYTTDKPGGNYSTALNLFYIKDRETWVRGGGPAPDYPDVTLYDYTKALMKEHLPEDERERFMEYNFEEMDTLMAEAAADGPEEPLGLIATLYTAAWAFSTLRYKLKSYEDAGIPPIMPEQADSIDRAISTWGELAQTDMAIEEMSELIKAILKYRRAHGKPETLAATGAIREEIADVYIMLAQLVRIFGGAEKIESIVQEKMTRLKDRLDRQGPGPKQEKRSGPRVITTLEDVLEKHFGFSGAIDTPEWNDALNSLTELLCDVGALTGKVSAASGIIAELDRIDSEEGRR